MRSRRCMSTDKKGALCSRKAGTVYGYYRHPPEARERDPSRERKAEVIQRAIRREARRVSRKRAQLRRAHA
jgi:hypothetical protein